MLHITFVVLASLGAVLEVSFAAWHQDAEDGLHVAVVVFALLAIACR